MLQVYKSENLVSVGDLESGDGVEIWNFFLNKKLFKDERIKK